MSVPDDEVPELVASVGALDGAVAVLREYLHRSGALQAVGVIERLGEGPAVVECGRLQAVHVNLGDRIVQLPHGVELDVEVPPLPDVRQLPAFEVDSRTGEVAGAVGGLQRTVDGVRQLADALGGRNVAMAIFETNDPEAPLAVTARAGGGEPPIVTLGDQLFELPEG